MNTSEPARLHAAVATAADRGPTATSAAAPQRSRLLWWALAAFAIQLAVWTAWFVLAAHHPVAEVPLASSR
ncbi:MAG TPA: hypothetical protein VHD62_04260 [Opitutaceae bacterium]|nr:hypothetical protein [Opitutaceae bacterium]